MTTQAQNDQADAREPVATLIEYAAVAEAAYADGYQAGLRAQAERITALEKALGPFADAYRSYRGNSAWLTVPTSEDWARAEALLAAPMTVEREP